MSNERHTPTEAEVYLEALRRVKPELRDLLEEKEEAVHLNRSLGQYLRWARSPKHRDRSLTRALRRVMDYPTVRQRLGQIVGELGGEQAVARLFSTLPGEPFPVPPGALMVCPVDPTHYRRRVQYAGQRFVCPEHNVPLVPASEVEQQ